MPPPLYRRKVGYALVLESPAHTSRDFQSCLAHVDDNTVLSPSDTTPRTATSFALLRSLSNAHEVEDESWLNSAFIDFVVSQFAKHYRNTCFMSIDFAVLGLSSVSRSNCESLTDISGMPIDYRDTKRQIVFVVHQKIHWNLIRVLRHPAPVLELYEPMGKPTSRHGGLSFRQVPQKVIEWLDMCCPLRDGKSWVTVGMSAITKQQQFTNFDCGVACLLYAEKCGQQQSKEDINNFTTQENITEYRKTLQEFTARMNKRFSSLNGNDSNSDSGGSGGLR